MARAVNRCPPPFSPGSSQAPRQGDLHGISVSTIEFQLGPIVVDADLTRGFLGLVGHANDLDGIAHCFFINTKLFCSASLAFLFWLTPTRRCGIFPHLFGQSSTNCRQRCRGTSDGGP